MVEVFAPTDIKRALDILEQNDVKIFAGGTDIMVRRRRWAGVNPKIGDKILNLDNISKLKEIYSDESIIEIGAGVTLSEIQSNGNFPEILKAAAGGMASPAIRNIATIGGNIVNSSPAGDMLPPLYALRAKLKIKSLKGEKVIAIDDFIDGPGKNILLKNELLVSIIIPNKKVTASFYKKVGTRKSIALSKVSIAAVVYKTVDSDPCVGIAFGSVGPKIVFSRDMEEEINGLLQGDASKGITEEGICSRIVEGYSNLIRPISDQRSTADYRKSVSIRLLRKFINKIIYSSCSKLENE